MTTPVDRAIAGLARAYQGRPRFVGLVGALVGPFNALETATLNLLAMLDPRQASGVYLDVMGQEVGQLRDVSALTTGATTMDDAQFAAMIEARGATNRSKGSRDTWVALMDALVNSPTNLALYGRRYVHFFDSGWQWISWTIWGTLTPSEAIVFPAVAEMFRPTGVRLQNFSTVVYPQTHYLGFADTQMPAGITISQRGTFEDADPNRPYFLESLPL